MRFFAVLLIFLLFSTSWAANTVRFYSPSSPTLTLSHTGFSYNVLVDAASDNLGATKTDPYDFYLPFHDNNDSNQYFRESDRAALPILVDGVATEEGSVSFYVDLNIDSGTKKIVFAASTDGGTSWNVVDVQASYTASTTYVATGFSISDLCSNTDSCANFTTTGHSQKYKVLMALLDNSSPIDLGTTGEADTSFTDATFFDLILNSKESTVTVDLNSVEQGDSVLTAYYLGSASIAYFNDVILFSHNGGSSAVSDLPIGSYNVNFLKEQNPAEIEGSIRASGLTNGVSYRLAVGFVDKFGFVTKLSNQITGTPIEIETFIQSQQCYLLSAGFQQEHYVLEYFRAFRDKILLKNFLGQKFVDFYYATAPQYTATIYKRPWLAAIVRTLAYGGYFILRYGLYMFVILGFGFFFYRQIKTFRLRSSNI